ncbi:glutaminyl-peptide cyclotransferase [Streptomyces sp. NPDC001514]
MRRTASALLSLWLVWNALAGTSWARSAEPTRAARSAPPPNSDLVADLTLSIVDEFRHDQGSFTQGLEMRGQLLYEGTGLLGHSAVQAGPVGAPPHVKEQLAPDLFGEGITLTGSFLWQLTWRNGFAIKRDAATLRERERVAYSGEGWGLCHQPGRKRLVMSNGSARLLIRDPHTFALLDQVAVEAAGKPVPLLNELECVGDMVYANILGSDWVARIDSRTGQVNAYIDASALRTSRRRNTVGALNGIAAVPGTQDLLLTGKNWPSIYRVSLHD